MKRLVEFPLERGGAVLVEVDEPPAGPVMRGIGKDHLAERTNKTFEEVTAAVAPAAASLITLRLRSISSPPAEITIGFGVQLSAQTGAFIAAASAAADFKVSLTWRGGAESSG